jgi:hypothetical protein
MQAHLDLRPIKQPIVFSTHHEREASQVGYDGSRAVFAIQPQQRPILRQLLRLQIGLNSCHCSTQFCPVLTEALVAKGTEPLMRMHLEDGSAGTHHFPALASRVAWGAEVSEPALRRRSIRCLGQGALACRFARAIDVEDNPLLTRSIP